MNIETALLLGDVNEAALAAVSGQAGIVTEVGRSQAVGVWVRLVTASLAAERSDIAVQTAYHAIEEMFRWPVDRYGPDIFIETVAGYGPPVRAHALAERFDRAGRDTDSALSLSAATQAVVGWTALGERARAQALINLWTPRAQAERAQPVCGGQAPFCVGDGFAHMLRVTDQLNSAWELTRLTPAQAITFDIADGRGLSRLEEHLARAGDARTAEQALSVCASDYATPLDIAEQCARLLVARAADRPLTAHEESLARYSNFAQTGPHGAASAMLTIAQRAARAGEAEVSDRSLAEALRIWSSAPDAQTELPQLIALQDIARRQLERQGRF